MTQQPPFIPLSAAAQHVGATVVVQGWLQTIRNQKRMQFLLLRDRRNTLQTVHERSSDPVLAETLSQLTRESTVRVTGTVEASPSAPNGVELRISMVETTSVADPGLPVDESSGPDIRMDWRHIDMRRPEVRLIFEIQTTVEWAMRNFWRREGFIEIHSPKLMGSPSESGAELFGLEYFGRQAYLAQSPQFYKQMAMAAGFDRVFEIAPVFRANPSFTSRHDTEFTSVDVEIAWVDSHEDVMCLEERWLEHVLNVVREQHGEVIRETYGVNVVVPSLPFPRLTMVEATCVLEDQSYRTERIGDLDPEGERLVAK